MKSILTKKVLFLALVAVTVFATGCIKEDLDECYKLTLKVVNHKGDDITALSVVSEAKLFIYDNNSKLLDTRDLNDAFIRGKETIELNYPESSKLHLIAWTSGRERGHQGRRLRRFSEERRRDRTISRQHLFRRYRCDSTRERCGWRKPGNRARTQNRNGRDENA